MLVLLHLPSLGGEALTKPAATLGGSHSETQRNAPLQLQREGGREEEWRVKSAKWERKVFFFLKEGECGGDLTVKQIFFPFSEVRYQCFCWRAVITVESTHLSMGEAIYFIFEQTQNIAVHSFPPFLM